MCAAVAAAPAEDSKVFYAHADSTSWGDYYFSFGQFYFGYSLSFSSEFCASEYCFSVMVHLNSAYSMYTEILACLVAMVIIILDRACSEMKLRGLLVWCEKE